LSLNRDSFNDLTTRFITGALVAGMGLFAVWLGGWWFTALVMLIVAALIWELARMLGADQTRALALGGLAAVVILLTKLLPVGLSLPLLLGVGILGVALLDQERRIFMVMAAMVMLASFGLILHRDGFGLTWMLWLVLVVVVTDIAGYFAGRIFGGPKFWPKVSPKKTWSGTAAGWLGAAGVGVHVDHRLGG